MRNKVLGVWAGPSDAGMTRDSIQSYADRLQRSGVNAVFMHVKGGEGRLYWPSQAFPDCVAPQCESFDFPAELLEACRSRGIEAHAWFIDYYEGEAGAAYRKHPEWAALNAAGKPTSEETLRGKHYGAVWMCPARRPGYTDQWLVPIVKEFAERYDFDGIHHDYIRYPGDLAPDQYCFCDDCLAQIPKFSGYLTDAFPEEAFLHDKYDRPYLEAHWEQSPRVLPAWWDKLDRTEKSRFLLEGSFFHGGRNDLDYFFYRYRVHWVTQFARDAAEAVREVRPKTQMSAAVFKNPIHSGRFLGQDWREFAPYVDLCIPMDYRDHFPGDFETYLTLLKESILSQKQWAAGFKNLCIGLAVNFLYKEEPNGPWPESKLIRAVETAMSCDVDGVVLFCDGQLTSYGMWDTIASISKSMR